MLMRLLCDEMLAGLSRWLRAAGHDSLLVNAGANDAAVLATAREGINAWAFRVWRGTSRGPFLACPACERIYWPGSHVRWMMTQLERWRAEAAVGPSVESPAV